MCIRDRIAGITQNPSQYNPLVFPEESQTRAQTVLDRMWEISDGVDNGDNQELVISYEMESRDWSSDVCSSDLPWMENPAGRLQPRRHLLFDGF